MKSVNKPPTPSAAALEPSPPANEFMVPAGFTQPKNQPSKLILSALSEKKAPAVEPTPKVEPRATPKVELTPKAKPKAKPHPKHAGHAVGLRNPWPEKDAPRNLYLFVDTESLARHLDVLWWDSDVNKKATELLKMLDGLPTANYKMFNRNDSGEVIGEHHNGFITASKKAAQYDISYWVAKAAIAQKDDPLAVLAWYCEETKRLRSNSVCNGSFLATCKSDGRNEEVSVCTCLTGLHTTEHPQYGGKLAMVIGSEVYGEFINHIEQLCKDKNLVYGPLVADTGYAKAIKAWAEKPMPVDVAREVVKKAFEDHQLAAIMSTPMGRKLAAASTTHSKTPSEVIEDALVELQKVLDDGERFNELLAILVAQTPDIISSINLAVLPYQDIQVKWAQMVEHYHLALAPAPSADAAAP